MQTVPHDPGVYLMSDKDKIIIYVGKAKDLKKRLLSYTRDPASQPPKTLAMLKKVRRVKTIITGTEKEALILEASLIKKYRPRYNVILRDDKNYPFLKVTINEEWPRLLMIRRRSKDGARYFGPFSSSSAMWGTLKHLNELFPLRRCKDKKLSQRLRPCLNYQMGRCPAPCVGKAARDEYLARVHNIILVLEGRNRDLIRNLKKEMARTSADLNFEQAALCRDRVPALEETLEKQIMVGHNLIDQDVFGLARTDALTAVSLVFVRSGVVNGHQSFFLPEAVGNDSDIIKETIERFYDADHPVPREILLPVEPDGLSFLTEWLEDLSGRKVVIKIPRRGNGVKLVEMAEANANQTINAERHKFDSWQSLAEQVKKELKLTRSPERIECVDISNIGGQQAVGSLVCYQMGEPTKDHYRHYKIRLAEGPDDYGMMKEVLIRRLGSPEKNDGLPDLLLLDGGKGQLNIGLTIIRELGLEGQVDLVSIAKEKQEEGEKLYRPGRKNPIVPARHSPVLLLMMRIRDESHRYGITFHRKWRQKDAMSSPLDKIPGVGPVLKERLLKLFGSLKKISQATEDTLAAVPGINKKLAHEIVEKLSNPTPD
ncbi:MAG: excinuclease ABC subunit UvrC [Proteobacteria bacterium]|nr:excinuclease ABC subunit UvrC [Pseudomonadota bacterium]MBU1714772.1 excinuclease ABC subunit UvrC [Pseudomonadota bacterium]